MNRDSILNIARTVFTQITPVKEEVYRGELRINQSAPAGIFFLDLSGNVSPEGFSEYQEKLLADEFYNHPGNLQWNYYLLLLQDQVDTTAKERIESNDKYARKYVLDEHEFEHFFTLERSAGQPIQNIVATWKEKLDIAGLHEVYTKVAYTTAIESFINNPARKTPPLSTTPASSTQAKIEFINKLILRDSYRIFPKQPRQFKFAKANLITGTNGSGKTSLLEAIELIVCGRTFRNPETVEKDNCVEAYINHNTILTETCTPSRSEKYRTRDLVWYNADYKTSNFTYASFNRFNFFNTDAANKLSNSTSEGEIKKALLSIILGPEYAYIQDRIKGFHERIRPLYNNLKKELNNSQTTISESESLIKTLKNSNSIEMLKGAVASEVEAMQFAKKISVGENIAPLEVIINQLLTLLQEALNTNGIVFRSLNDLNLQTISFNKTQETYNALKTELDSITASLQEGQNNSAKSKEKQTVLIDALKYLEDTRALNLKGLRLRKSKIFNDQRNLQAIKKAIDSVDLTNYIVDSTLDVYKQNVAAKLSVTKIELTNTNIQINVLLGKLGNIQSLVAQIKALGKEWVSVEPNSDSCPLCQTQFTRGNLILAIDMEVSSNSTDQREIDNLTAKQKQIQSNIDTLSLELENLGKISLAYEFMRKLDSVGGSLSTIVNQIEELLSQEQSLLNSSESLQALEEWAAAAGLTEETLSTTERKLEELFGNTLQLSESNKSQFTTLKDEAEKATNQLNSEIERLHESRASLGLKIKAELELPEQTPIRHSEVIEMLNLKNSRLLRAHNVVNQIQKIIAIKPDTDLMLVQGNLSSLEKNVLTLKSYYQDQVLLKNAEDQKKRAEDYIRKNKLNLERIESGFNILIELNAGEDTLLNTFFDQNLTEVNDIFKTIHAPREFSAIKADNGQLYLIKNSGEQHKVSEISTGQRAALALSLFISLNRKLIKGPDIIIFDDPIAHIDDMNVLSFLDFLRFFILKENKQIFFSTANDRLASLIERKFAFLERDFVKINLHRD